MPLSVVYRAIGILRKVQKDDELCVVDLTRLINTFATIDDRRVKRSVERRV